MFHPWKSPAKFFTIGEKAIWRNIAAWAFEDDWIELPGPASWWPENDEDLDATGFYFSGYNTGHYEAMQLVLASEKLEGNLYERVFPSYSDLRIMEDDSTNQSLLNAYFGI